ncbi:prephenate dehydrogenase/arogenate dehydrogenase family protein [Methylobacterium radiodurans]|uniref:Prephenate dehydrogenase/arogenate dehydrogenase family protein n=1 Tax=Methylobacterium radiodurans TaxID=2202828 RepID=A0A2U8VTV9_9HYPH|nr:prephenate dehydrogenase [Methylobacterium radiodurans]AWN36838.1 prephenate dehydrogenase/arogenate dehydrogenase family protein [Methylobacterium radiodurans]
MSSPLKSPAPSVGLIGFGAFGRLIARHLAPHLRVLAYDPFVAQDAFGPDAVPADLATAAACPVVILATPVSGLRDVARAVAPHLRPGALVADVGSVKVVPAAILRAELPAHVAILATHPLFGPQSARDGLAGLKVAVCPVRGRRGLRAAAFLRRVLGLEVILTTPEAHDREMASVQGLTHLIAKVLVRMEPLPSRMTTRSFERILEAVEMVRHDAPEVFAAIERQNPFAPEVRRRFFALAAELEAELDADRQSPRLALAR